MEKKDFDMIKELMAITKNDPAVSKRLISKNAMAKYQRNEISYNDLQKIMDIAHDKTNLYQPKDKLKMFKIKRVKYDY